MRTIYAFLSMVLLVTLQASIAFPTSILIPNPKPNQSQIEPGLASLLERLSEEERVTVIVTLNAEADLSEYSFITWHSRQARRSQLLNQLQRFASSSQQEILTELKAWEQSGQVENVVPFWIFNGFSLTASAEAVRALSQHPEVARISTEIIAHAPVEPESTNLAPANLDTIGVTRVWDQGYFGQGIVVASLDTGVDYTHPDLAANWRGGANSWYDPFGEHPDTPFAVSSHGTWTMGVMVGNGANGTTTGIAPQAQWIAAKIFDDSGIATETAIHLSYQWLLDPDGDPDTDDAPDVVNNSWGFDLAGCITSLSSDLRVLRTAGILPVFSAGNSGPSTNTSVSPANNAEAFPVGAINGDNQIHLSSSRGPSACDPQDVFPALVAPGERIMTTSPHNSYANPSGTSLSAPHVTGALALLLSARSDLDADEQEQLLISSAKDLGSSGPDSDYGYGLLDVWAAFQQLGVEQTPAYEWDFFLPFITEGASTD